MALFKKVCIIFQVLNLSKDLTSSICKLQIADMLNMIYIVGNEVLKELSDMLTFSYFNILSIPI